MLGTAAVTNIAGTSSQFWNWIYGTVWKYLERF
jgi:hypothetical protein